MSNKPFACKHDGCKESFANVDHCLVHQKRHEMILNVGLANKSEVFADQTPTPTRFIRNCEEVGLFQDLQNVNPFDETFKKAIDHSKNSPKALFVANDVSDDTLHTPHIFPHIEAASCKTSTSNDISNISSAICTDLDSDSPLDRSDGLIIIDDSEEEVDQIIIDINQSNLQTLPETRAVTGYCIETSPSPEKRISCASEEINIVEKISCVSEEVNINIVEKISCVPEEVNINIVEKVSCASEEVKIVDTISLKEKLRERLQTRNGVIEGRVSPTKNQCLENASNEKYLPQPVRENEHNNILTNTYSQSLVVHKPLRKRRCVLPIPKVVSNESIVSSSTEITSADGIEPDEDALVVCDKEEDRKLRNRVAQSRSRLRKKIQTDELNVEFRNLQTKTDNLKLENKALKKQIHELKKYILTHHQKCAFTGDMIFLKKCLTEEVPDRNKLGVVPTSGSLPHKRKILPALPKNTPALQPIQLHPSPNPIIVSVPPIKLPATEGNVKIIVITPPPT